MKILVAAMLAACVVTSAACTDLGIGEEQFAGSDAATSNDAPDASASSNDTAAQQVLPSSCETNPDCNNGDPCKVAAVCIDGACEKKVPAVYTTVACDDKSACTTGDKCDSGKCSGASVNCDDGNNCTTDSCDAASGCKKLPIAVACSDGDACTAGDKCVGGACESTPTQCDDKNPCTSDSCDKVKGCVYANNTNGCDDGTVCTEGDVCKDGACGSGKAKVCDDSKQCTDDSCDAKTGCKTGQSAKGTPCEDGNSKTIGDACDAGACKAGAPNTSCKADADCSQLQGNACYTYSCDSASGLCSAKAKATVDDNNACTIEFCDSATGLQSKVNVGAACSDNEVCTEGDACDAAAKCVGKLKSCDDSNACTVDSCEAGKGCAFKAQPAAACDDGKNYTIDSCDAKLGCMNVPNNVIATCAVPGYASCTVKLSLKVAGVLYPFKEQMSSIKTHPLDVCPKLGAADDLVVNALVFDGAKGVWVYKSGEYVTVTDELALATGGKPYVCQPGDVSIAGAAPDWDCNKSVLAACK